MKKWMQIRKAGNYDEIGQRNHISPILARLLKNRGIEEDAGIPARSCPPPRPPCACARPRCKIPLTS